MYEKIARSLSRIPEYEIHICGQGQENSIPPKTGTNIHPHTLIKSTRAFYRFTALLSFFRLLLQIKPDIIIASTPDLLLVSAIYKRWFKAKLIYDVRENFILNRNNRNNRSIWFNLNTKIWSLLEQTAARSADMLWAAEQVYPKQLPFFKQKPFEIIENKYAPILSETINRSKSIDYVYSGTIALEYGILEAIHFFKFAHKHNPKIKCVIIGYCINRNILKKIQHEIGDSSYIQLIGGATIVPHQQIIEVLHESKCAVLPYTLKSCFEGKIPTKVFECIASKTIILSQENQTWNSFLEQHKVGLSINFKSPDLTQLQTINAFSLGTQDIAPAIYRWESEENKMFTSIKSLRA